MQVNGLASLWLPIPWRCRGNGLIRTLCVSFCHLLGVSLMGVFAQSTVSFWQCFHLSCFPHWFLVPLPMAGLTIPHPAHSRARKEDVLPPHPCASFPMWPCTLISSCQYLFVNVERWQCLGIHTRLEELLPKSPCPWLGSSELCVKVTQLVVLAPWERWCTFALPPFPLPGNTS